MALYKVKDGHSNVNLPGYGMVRPGQFVRGEGLERHVGSLLVEVPDAPGKPLEHPKTEDRLPLEAEPKRVPLESLEVPSDPPLTEESPSKKRRQK